MNVAASARVELRATAEANTPTVAANHAANPARIAATSTPKGWIAPQHEAHGPGDQQRQADPPGTPDGAELLGADHLAGRQERRRQADPGVLLALAGDRDGRRGGDRQQAQRGQAPRSRSACAPLTSSASLASERPRNIPATTG